MLKKIIVIACLILLLCFSAFLVKNTKPTPLAPVQGKPEVNTEMFSSDKIFSYNAENINSLCDDKNELCAVENAVKCTIKPDLSACKTLHLPRFVFMDGGNVDRPTEITYKITKYTLDSNKKVSIQTESSCNATWFGICQGRIVYILNNTPDGWIVEDVFSIEDN